MKLATNGWAGYSKYTMPFHHSVILLWSRMILHSSLQKTHIYKGRGKEKGVDDMTNAIQPRFYHYAKRQKKNIVWM